jgi:Tfp pilus assembly protein PilO
MNRQLRRTRLFGIMALGVLAIVLWQYLLAPRFMTPVDIRKEVDATHAQTAVLQGELTNLQNKAKDVQALVDQADALAIALPSDANNPELSEQITKAAKAAGMSVGQVTFFETGALDEWVDPAKKDANGKATTTTTPKTDTTTTDTDTTKTTDSPGTVKLPTLALYTMPVRIVANGNMGELSRFLNILQTSGRAMVFDQVQISPWEANGKATSRFQLQITAHAFTTKDIGPAPKGSASSSTNP